MFTKLTSSFSYLVKGVRKYPHYTATQKRFNYFLNFPERNDIQKGIPIEEPINFITLQKVSFNHEKDKPVLKEVNLVFQKGKVNYLQAPNGFGQKQLIDLKETLQKCKEVYIFDEAENNLDKNNNEIIKKKLEMLGREKLVIIMRANDND
ncbi:12951_t:CDS:2 [Funneliformis geosporum]|nr:12951_t:CDS:2 [Funneliformis geosporum]